VHQSLVKHLKKEVVMAHVSRIPCPAHMCKRVLHVHKNNGVFVAVDKEGCLYAACTTCKIAESAQAVSGTLGEKYQWVPVDEETLKGLQGTFLYCKKKKGGCERGGGG
jgi:hypothetical protein